jgi:hypothetical protein
MNSRRSGIVAATLEVSLLLESNLLFDVNYTFNLSTKPDPRPVAPATAGLKTTFRSRGLVKDEDRAASQASRHGGAECRAHCQRGRSVRRQRHGHRLRTMRFVRSNGSYGYQQPGVTNKQFKIADGGKTRIFHRGSCSIYYVPDMNPRMNHAKVEVKIGS